MFRPIALAALLLGGGTTHTAAAFSFDFSVSSKTSCSNQQSASSVLVSTFASCNNGRRKRHGILTCTQLSASPDEGRERYASECEQIERLGFFVRRGQFRDLPAVADLMMDAFYSDSSIMYHYHRMLELDRLQANFPYDPSRHDFFVACCPDGRIIGFVDVDARPSIRKDAPPRPYLSDLAVSTEWRRKGIATSLIERCEAMARDVGCGKLYLRVERSNDAALQMYCDNMAYEKRQHPVFGVKDTTILLRCDLQTRLEMSTETVKEEAVLVGLVAATPMEDADIDEEGDEKDVLVEASNSGDDARWSRNNCSAVESGSVLDYSV